MIVNRFQATVYHTGWMAASGPQTRQDSYEALETFARDYVRREPAQVQIRDLSGRLCADIAGDGNQVTQEWTNPDL